METPRLSAPEASADLAGRGAQSGSDIKIGLLHSLSGTMALSEEALLDAELMAVDEINRAGGVLGHHIEPVIADGASLPERFALAAQDLLAAGVSALFGCWTSASRKAVRPVVETGDSQLWYPVQYEGLEESPCICYAGSCLNQQIMPAAEWTLEQFGDRLFLLGSDYVFPRTANQLIRSLVAGHGGSIAAERYVELGAQDFGEAIAQILQTQPSAVISTLNGDSNLAFYRQYRAAGILPAQIPVVATSVTEIELESVASAAVGHFACWSYFQSLDTPENREFVGRFTERYGRQRLVSAPLVTAYVQLYLWKQAAERAGSCAPREVRRCLPGCALLSPMGELRIEANHHVSMPVRIGRLNAAGQFDIVWRRDEPIAPLPWLGVENQDFLGKAMVLQSLAAFSEGVDHHCLLEREITERKALESALAAANADLEGKVNARTRELARTIDDLGKEVAERQRAEGELVQERHLLRTLIDSLPDYSIYAKDRDGRFIVANAGVARAMGMQAPEELLGKTDFDCHPHELAAQYRADELEVIESGRPLLDRAEPVVGSGTSQRWFSTTKVPLRDGAGNTVGLVGIGRDITARMQAEADRERLQNQLTQALKMESVGRLAGGVAHDFNNLLMGIMNYVELCRDALPADHPVRCYLDEITSDAQRSADITRQLLAFARKQIIAPRALDLNDALAGMLKMLRHLIGEDIELAWQPGANLWPVKMDPGQVDQILANLCVNARDAIGGVGRVTIETASVTLDTAYCACHAGVVPGAYVRLSVSDDGCGMDKDVLAHLFEPFFTTKGVGQGTGLGLATVYGIVEQNHGRIDVQSEPGRGTMFTIYLPRDAGAAVEPVSMDCAMGRPRGTETILLVEDGKAVRVTTQRFLGELGYAVLVAERPEEALRLAAAHGGPIHLLITDVVMPGMSGCAVAKGLIEQRPETKCLFMSGYPASAIMHRGVPDEETHFLAKPFSRDELARKVREVLDH